MYGWLVGVGICVCVMSMPAAGAQGRAAGSAGAVSMISAVQAREALRDGALIIDARPAEAFAARTIKGAVNLPCLAASGDVRARDSCARMVAGAVVDRTRSLIVVAGPDDPLGRRAARLARRLGYPMVYWLRGGLAEWESRGLHTQ